LPGERLDSLAAVLHAIRFSSGVTQPLLTTQVGLGRNVVAQRVAELEALGLVVPDGLAPSSGGRAPRQLRLRAEAGVVIAMDIGATGLSIGVADLTGRLLDHVAGPVDIAVGPERMLRRAEELIDELLERAAPKTRVWGIGVGVPGPVEFATGLPVAPPIMPGWDGYPIRERLSRRYSAPTWVDNDANVLAVAELRASPSVVPGEDLLYVKIGMGIGAGLVSEGRLHRGANGCAGDIGHVAVAEATTSSAAAATSAASKPSPVERRWPVRGDVWPRPAEVPSWPSCSSPSGASPRRRSPSPPSGATRPLAPSLPGPVVR